MNHHPSHVAASSQCGKVLRVLQLWGGCFVPLTHLAEAAGAYAIHSRIADLRRRGYSIENKVERGERSQCKSWYRLRKGAA
jgi:biotin operon repressor